MGQSSGGVNVTSIRSIFGGGLIFDNVTSTRRILGDGLYSSIKGGAGQDDAESLANKKISELEKIVREVSGVSEKYASLVTGITSLEKTVRALETHIDEPLIKSLKNNIKELSVRKDALSAEINQQVKKIIDQLVQKGVSLYRFLEISRWLESEDISSKGGRFSITDILKLTASEGMVDIANDWQELKRLKLESDRDRRSDEDMKLISKPEWESNRDKARYLSAVAAFANLVTDAISESPSQAPTP